MAKKKSSKTKINPNDVIKNAVTYGINEIVKQHPRFGNLKDYIASHIDQKGIQKAWDYANKSAQEGNIPADKIRDYLTKKVADYVASGEVFDERGKETILRKSLEEKASSGLFKGFFARRALEGEKYFDKALGAFNELNEMFKAGRGYEMPELEKPLTYLNRIGFAAPAAELLKETGLISGGQYRSIKSKIKKGAKASTQEFAGKLEQYATYQKAAAVVVGISSLLILGYQSVGKLSGFVVGNSITNSSFMQIVLIFAVLASVVIFKRGHDNLKKLKRHKD